MDDTTTMLGQEQSRSQVFAGLYLLAGGVVSGIIAVALFLYANTLSGSAIYSWREGALALGAIALTTFFLGVSVALPSNRFMRIASAVGVVLCIVAIALFMVHYPFNFNVPGSEFPGQTDYTALDTLIFVAGLAIIVAGAFMAVVQYYVHRLQVMVTPGSTHTREIIRERLPEGQTKGRYDDHDDRNYEVPDWVVERDLEDAMAKHGYEWGMGDRIPELNINVRDEMPGAYASRGRVNVVEMDPSDNDEALNALNAMRPSRRDKKVVEDTEVDDPVAALRAFRKQMAEDPKKFKVKK